ncbi:hypothetical protein EV426DRAFT_532097 [Tirmania nivea]|nr:hypothetical protein EV426DRAFT_532097 [Tirmania nivea]
MNAQLPPGRPAPPGIKAQILDFSKMSRGLALSYPNHFALVIDNCFTQEECEKLIAIAETDEVGWQHAQVNVGGGMQVTALEIRNSGRIIRDDYDMASLIFERVKPFLDEVQILQREGTRWSAIMTPVNNPRKAMRFWGQKWEMVRLNERMRFLRYGLGQYFEPHYDGCFTTLQVRPHEPEQRTFLTLQVYLRSSNDLKGGATRFFSLVGGNESEFYDVEAVPGRVLIFQHRGFFHSGAEVVQGEKIALRSDILYRQIE